MKVSRITILVKSNERVDQGVARAIRLGGKKLRVKRYITSSSNTICGRYSCWGHAEHWCMQGTKARCSIYPENYKESKYRYTQLEYKTAAEVYYRSTVVRYPNYKGVYRATSNKCEIVREVREKVRKTENSRE